MCIIYTYLLHSEGRDFYTCISEDNYMSSTSGPKLNNTGSSKKPSFHQTSGHEKTKRNNLRELVDKHMRDVGKSYPFMGFCQ